MSPGVRLLTTSLMGFALPVLAGCGSAPQPCPVSGRVFIDDRPAAGVYVVFSQAGGGTKASRPSTARTDREGAFALQVPQPGEYAITAFRPQLLDDAGTTVEGEDLLRGRYRDPRRPVQKVAVGEGENVLPPIQLHSR